MKCQSGVHALFDLIHLQLVRILCCFCVEHCLVPLLPLYPRSHPNHGLASVSNITFIRSCHSALVRINIMVFLLCRTLPYLTHSSLLLRRWSECQVPHREGLANYSLGLRLEWLGQWRQCLLLVRSRAPTLGTATASSASGASRPRRTRSMPSGARSPRSSAPALVRGIAAHAGTSST